MPSGFVMARGAIASALVVSFAAITAFAEREVTIGDYSEMVRRRVAAKITEALATSNQIAKVSGTVTFADDGYFFMQRDNDGIKVIVEGNGPKVGDVVTVSGGPTLEGGRVAFAAEGWERIGSAPLPRPRPVSMDELISGNGGRNGVNWLLVAIAGRVINVIDGGVALSVDGVPVNVHVRRLPDSLAESAFAHPKVTVKGVVELMLDQSSLVGRQENVIGVKIDVESVDDIVIVPDIAYITARHNRRLMLIGSGVAALLGCGCLLFLTVFFFERRRLFRTRTIMAERKRMADDLHDTIEQHLVGAGMMLKLGRLQEAEGALVRAKREIRDIVWGLMNDDMMRQSPADMVRELAKEENKKGIYRVDTRLVGLPQSLSPSAMRDLSLIVRESIGNAVKHGGARKIAISSEIVDGKWRLQIANDGSHFDPQAVPGAKDGHFGLEGMRQRAVRLGAKLSFSVRKNWMVVELEGKA